MKSPDHAAPEAAGEPGERLQMRVQAAAVPGAPTLIYLPGLHGDWTLAASLRSALAGRARFVDFTYPRTLTWSLRDYARAVRDALLQQGVEAGWLIGESFGSQVVWPLLELSQAEAGARTFQPSGIVLAGGFVRHPWPCAVRWAAGLLARAPLAAMGLFLRLYCLYARFRHLRAPETGAALGEFVARRTDLDRRAAVHRLRLIASAHPESAAVSCPVPVHYLAGAVDPLVPCPLVRAWLRRHCGAYRGGRTLWRADHNVLATAPRAAAEQLLAWAQAGQAGSPVRPA